MNKISITTLGSLIEFQRGYDLPKSNFSEGNIPVISSNGILGYHNEYKVKGPGITIGRSGTVGLPHYIEENFYPHNTSLYIKDFKGNNPKYIYYLLKTLGLNDRGSGSGVPTMNRNHLHPLKVSAYLNIQTQKQIANVLSSLDSKIALNNRINAELEAMAKTVYDYWFVQFDFPFDFAQGKPSAEGKPYKSSGGKMVWCEELKRDVPEGWEVDNLMKVSKLEGGGTPNKAINEYWNGDISFYTPSDYTNSLFVMKTESSITEVGLKNCSSKLFPKGSIFITARGTVGNVSIASENMAMNQSCYAFCEKEGYGYCYLYYTVSSLINVLKAKSGGSVFNSIVSNDIKYTKLPIPTESVAKKYMEICDPIFSKILITQQENQQLSSLRDWLLPMLMNGQVRVGAQNYAEMGEGDVLMAAEGSVGYGINNSIKSDKKWTIGNRTILAGYIIKRFNCKGFGRVMLMKLLFLVEYICKIDFESHYVVNVAGPYDDLIREIELKLRTYKLFNAKQDKFGNQVSYEDMGGSDIVESLFTESFCQEADLINSTLDKFMKSKWDQCEIVATMYAVWNNRILNNYQINDIVLKQDFLNWDPQKIKYENRLDATLDWMRKKDIVPIGWGKLIEK